MKEGYHLLFEKALPVMMLQQAGEKVSFNFCTDNVIENQMNP